MRSRLCSPWSTLPAGLAFLALSAVSRPAAAYPLNPWGAHTPTGYVALNPFLYVYSGPALYPIVYVSGGLTDQLDIIGGIAGYAYLDGGGGGVDYLELMPRYFWNESMGVTVHLVYGLPGSDGYPDTLQVGPEFHGVFGGDTMALTLNAGWAPAVVFGSGFQTGSVFVKAAPEYNFSAKFSVFLEVDPAYDLDASAFGLLLVPGVGFALDEDQTHTFSVGLQIDTADSGGDFVSNNLSVGLWYATGWGGE